MVYIKKGKKRLTTDLYSTPGFATELLGDKNDRTKLGALLINTMKEQFNSKYFYSSYTLSGFL